VGKQPIHCNHLCNGGVLNDVILLRSYELERYSSMGHSWDICCQKRTNLHNDRPYM
jgi:hypothetical protein